MDIKKDLINIIKIKYKFSEKHFKDNNILTIDKHIYYYDMMNTLSLFPKIISIEINNNNNNYNKNTNDLLNLLSKKRDKLIKTNGPFKENIYYQDLVNIVTNIYDAEKVNLLWLQYYEILNCYKLFENISNPINVLVLYSQKINHMYAMNHYIRQTYNGKLIFYTKKMKKIDKHIIESYKKKYKKNNINLFSIEYNKQDTDINTVIGYIKLVLSISKIKSNLIIKLIDDSYDEIQKSITQLIPLYKKVSLCKPTICSPIHGDSLYCICENFISDGNVDNSNSDTYDINQIINLFLYKSITDINMYLFINKTHKFLKDGYYERLKHNYTNNYINLNNIQKITNKNRLTKKEFKRSYEYTSKFYSKYILKIDVSFDNGIYMYYLIGETDNIEYKYKNLPIDPKYNIHKDSTRDDKFILIATRCRTIIRENICKYFCIYGKYNIIKSLYESIKYIKNNNPNLKFLEIYDYGESTYVYNTATQYTNKELIEALNKKCDIMTNYTSIKNMENISDKISVKKGTIYNVVNAFGMFSVIYKGRGLFNIFVEIMIDMVKKMSHNDALIMVVSFVFVNILDLVNLISKYFKHTDIFSFKYFDGHIVYVVFNVKNEDPSDEEILKIKKACSSGNLSKLYSDDIDLDYKDFIDDIDNRYFKRMNIITDLGNLKINDDPRYNILMETIKPYQMELYNNFINNTI